MMKALSRRHLLAQAAAVAGGALVLPSFAQSTYPDRPIRLLVPFPAGGPVDVMGRLVAQHLSTTLGQQVILDNRPGAGATIAGKAAATADPDGYTLLVGSAATFAIGPTLYPNAGYDPVTAFAPIAFVSSVPYVMITRPQAPQRTVGELIAYAKANPGKLNKVMSDTVDDPTIRRRLVDLGLEILPPEQRSPEYLAKYLPQEIERWGKVIKAAGISMD